MQENSYHWVIKCATAGPVNTGAVVPTAIYSLIRTGFSYESLS